MLFRSVGIDLHRFFLQGADVLFLRFLLWFLEAMTMNKPALAIHGVPCSRNGSLVFCNQVVHLWSSQSQLPLGSRRADARWADGAFELFANATAGLTFRCTPCTTRTIYTTQSSDNSTPVARKCAPRTRTGGKETSRCLLFSRPVDPGPVA